MIIVDISCWNLIKYIRCYFGAIKWCLLEPNKFNIAVEKNDIYSNMMLTFVPVELIRSSIAKILDKSCCLCFGWLVVLGLTAL